MESKSYTSQLKENGPKGYRVPNITPKNIDVNEKYYWLNFVVSEKELTFSENVHESTWMEQAYYPIKGKGMNGVGDEPEIEKSPLVKNRGYILYFRYKMKRSWDNEHGSMLLEKIPEEEDQEFKLASYYKPKARSTSTIEPDSGCIAKLGSGKRKGQRCGCKQKYPVENPEYCGRHKKLSDLV